MKKFSSSDLKSYSGYFILAIILFVLYKLGLFTKGGGGGTGGGFLGGLLGENYASPLDSLEVDLAKYKKIGIVPTKNDSFFSSAADTIETENKSANTSEETIYDIFRELRNEPDLIKLKLAFGERRPNFSFTASALGAFLRSDLNESEMQELNAILKKRALTTL